MGEVKRWYICSRRCCFFFILVLAVVLFFSSTDMGTVPNEWNPKQWIQSQAPKWLMLFKIKSQSVDPSNMTVLWAVGQGATSELTSTTSTTDAIADTTEVTLEKNSLAFLQNETITSTWVTETTATKTSTNASVVLHTLVPYVSPERYLVEYPYKYRFIINEPQECKQHKPFLVLMVPVAPNNRAHRDIIRNTWGGESPVLGKMVKLFFLVGLDTREGAKQVQEQLFQESTDYHNVIQSDFLDCYKNLTIKTMVMLEWLDMYCSSASYAMKVDSDMFLNVPKLINMLLNAPKTNYMTGLIAQGSVVQRDPSSKWYLPVNIYPKSQYPRYALGLGYVLTLDLPKKLVEASRHVKAVYIEDVYLGLCMQHLNIPPTDPPDWNYFHVFPLHYSRCAFSKIIATTIHESIDRMWIWTDFTKPGPSC